MFYTNNLWGLLLFLGLLFFLPILFIKVLFPLLILIFLYRTVKYLLRLLISKVNGIKKNTRNNTPASEMIIDIQADQA